MKNRSTQELVTGLLLKAKEPSEQGGTKMSESDKEKTIDELVEGLVSVSLAAKRLSKKALSLKDGGEKQVEGKDDVSRN